MWVHSLQSLSIITIPLTYNMAGHYIDSLIQPTPTDINKFHRTCNTHDYDDPNSPLLE
jgi:hypothetical protein